VNAMNYWNHREICIFANSKAVADFAIKRWREISLQSIANKGFFAVALAGGETPIDFYKRLSSYNRTFPWDRTDIFWADERYIPPNSNDSNYYSIKEHLLKRIHIPEKNIHPVPTQEETLDRSAKKYEEDIRGFFALGNDTFPEFDLIMLGIGEDGHTASLFPGTLSLQEQKRLAIPVITDRFPNERISFTLPVINNAKNIIFLVSGVNKASIVKEILEDKKSALPAALVKPKNGTVLLVMDQKAASLLSHKKGKQ
jgi:6-phosphogluconolactonase